MTAKHETKLQQLYFWGQPFSPLYSCLMANRSNFYRKGIFKQHKLDAPVISVGNLVLGGTGKTPLVHYITKLLLQHGKRPAVLSRGYKGAASGPINVVSDGKDILLDAVLAGDEPRLLAEKLPGVPVLTGKKRFITGKHAIDSLGADHLILDDGFQHMSLKRDIDLVLFSSRKLLGNGRVLPGGDLREPLSALKRADAFVITGIDLSPGDAAKEFITFLNELCPEKPVFAGSYSAEGHVLRLHNRKSDSLTIEEIRQMQVYGFCGIAQPDSFQNIMQKAGINLAGFLAFEDHHAYTREDMELLRKNCLSSGAKALITTEKDLVKIRDLLPGDFPLLALPLRFHMNSDFDQYLLHRLGES